MSETGTPLPPSARETDLSPTDLEFFVGLYRIEHPERLRTNFASHLAWATEQEASGRIFMTGPLTVRGEDGTSGLTVFRVGSLAEADALARTDPFVVNGVNSVQMLPWKVAGGAINVSLRLSNSGLVIR